MISLLVFWLVVTIFTLSLSALIVTATVIIIHVFVEKASNGRISLFDMSRKYIDTRMNENAVAIGISVLLSYVVYLFVLQEESSIVEYTSKVAELASSQGKMVTVAAVAIFSAYYLIRKLSNR